MEKWASKWLEMHSQRHRFKLQRLGGGGGSIPRGFQPPSHTVNLVLVRTLE